jgi:Fe2+ or Zn2+ uptake regulation protein
MQDSNLQEEFNLLGLDLSEVRFLVLEAIALAGRKTGASVTFAQLNQILTDLRKGKKTAKPQIYRYITELEELGLIRVDRSEYRNRYETNIQLIANSLISLKSITRRKLGKGIEAIKEEKRELEQISLTRLSREFSLLLTGKELQQQPRVIEGIEAIHNVIESIFYELAGTGDIVRSTLDWVNIPENLETVRWKAVKRIVEKGAQYRIMYRLNSAPNREKLKMRKDEYSSIKKEFSNISLKQSRKETKSYDGLSLNRESILLIVTESPLTAIYVPRSENAELVDSFVNTYDEEFANAEDVIDLQEV